MSCKNMGSGGKSRKMPHSKGVSKGKSASAASKGNRKMLTRLNSSSRK